MKNLFTFLILFIVYLALKEDTTLTVFDENNEDIYKMYIVEMDNLNTRNFNDYFKEFEVVLIKPDINKVYEDKLDINYFGSDLEELKKYYINRLKDKGYYIEANKYLVMPIKIKKVMINSTMGKIYDYLKRDGYYITIESDNYVKITN